MKQERNNPTQISQILRVLCAGYLLYTAWDLREAFQDSPIYIAAAVLFALVGLLLGGISLYQIIKEGDFFYKQTPDADTGEADESKDCEERLDD